MSEHPFSPRATGLDPLADPPTAPRDRQREVQRQFLYYTASVRAYIRGLVPPQLDPEEVVQNSFLVAMDKADQFEPGSNFLAWIFNIARLEVLTHIRDHKRRAEHAMAPEVLGLLADSSPDREPVERRLAALRYCMEKLSPAAYRLLKLFYFENISAGRIAEQLSMRVQSVYNGLDRARIRLRQCVEQRLAEEEGPE